MGCVCVFRFRRRAVESEELRMICKLEAACNIAKKHLAKPPAAACSKIFHSALINFYSAASSLLYALEHNIFTKVYNSVLSTLNKNEK